MQVKQDEQKSYKCRIFYIPPLFPKQEAEGSSITITDSPDSRSQMKLLILHGVKIMILCPTFYVNFYIAVIHAHLNRLLRKFPVIHARAFPAQQFLCEKGI